MRKTVLGRPRTSVTQRFWANVNKGPRCWLWTGHIYVGGYGKIRLDPPAIGAPGKQRGAHQFSYELHNGPIPNGLEIRHLCGNPACVNPDHLTVGTTKENGEDKVRHGNSLQGEKHHKAKLTEMAIRAIRRAYAFGTMTHQDLADTFGISKSAVQWIVQRRSWRHVK